MIGIVMYFYSNCTFNYITVNGTPKLENMPKDVLNVFFF